MQRMIVEKVEAAQKAAAARACVTVPSSGLTYTRPQSKSGVDPGGVIYCVEGEGLTKATVREEARFTISASAANGSSVAVSGGFFVHILGVAKCRARVVALDDLRHEVTWRPPISGTYRICVSRFGWPLPGSPWTLEASTPEPCASQCHVSGDGLMRAVARETAEFEITFRDRLGVVTHAAPLDCFLEPQLAISEQELSAAPAPASWEATADETVREEGLAVPLEDTTLQPKSGLTEAPPTPAREMTAGRVDERHSAAPAGGASEIGHQACQHSQQGGAFATIGTELASSPGEAAASVAPAPADLPCADGKGGSSGGSQGGSSSETSRVERVRRRNLRVKVVRKSLAVRSAASPESELLGHLLPGTVARIIEERAMAAASVDGEGGYVYGCVSLTHLEKVTAEQPCACGMCMCMIALPVYVPVRRRKCSTACLGEAPTDSTCTCTYAHDTCTWTWTPPLPRTPHAHAHMHMAHAHAHAHGILRSHGLHMAHTIAPGVCRRARLPSAPHAQSPTRCGAVCVPREGTPSGPATAALFLHRPAEKATSSSSQLAITPPCSHRG